MLIFISAACLALAILFIALLVQWLFAKYALGKRIKEAVNNKYKAFIFNGAI